jgi:hypothetical protein
MFTKEIVLFHGTRVETRLYDCMPVMQDSPIYAPVIYTIQNTVERIETGQMNGCVSVVALCHPHGGRYQNICAQHGGGSVSNIHFSAINHLGNITDSHRTKYFVIFPPSSGSIIDILEGVTMYLENNRGQMENSVFEFYYSPNAEVTRNGQVIDLYMRRIVPKVYSFIAKYYGLVADGLRTGGAFSDILKAANIEMTNEQAAAAFWR